MPSEKNRFLKLCALEQKLSPAICGNEEGYSKIRGTNDMFEIGEHFFMNALATNIHKV